MATDSSLNNDAAQESVWQLHLFFMQLLPLMEQVGKKVSFFIEEAFKFSGLQNGNSELGYAERDNFIEGFTFSVKS